MRLVLLLFIFLFAGSTIFAARVVPLPELLNPELQFVLLYAIVFH